MRGKDYNTEKAKVQPAATTTTKNKKQQPKYLLASPSDGKDLSRRVQADLRGAVLESPGDRGKKKKRRGRTQT